MATLTIGNKSVTVDDSFRSMSPDQQQAAVEEIAKSIGAQASPQAPSGPPPGAVPGSREYADWAASAARSGQKLPAVGPQPGPALLHDKFRDAPAPVAPEDQPQVENNPLASQLPGPLGQLHNTFQAATAGGLNSSLFNLGQEAYAGAMGVPKAIMDASQGKGFDYPRAFQDELALSEQTEADKRALNPQAYDTGGALGTIASLGKAKGAPMVAIPAITRGAVTKAALTGGGVGAVTGLGDPGSVEDRLKNALGNGVFGAIVGGIGGKVLSGAAKEVVPTAKQLKAGYQGAFKAAEDTGAVIGQKSIDRYAQDALQLLKGEGAVTPSGKVAGFPKVAHAIAMMDDFASGDMSILQAKTLRKAVAGAAKSTDPEERYVGVQLLNHFDRYMENLKPGEFISGDGKAAVNAWSKGRALYQVAKKGEAVSGLVTAADRQAKKSAHVSGEQALRNKFDTFTSKPKNLRGYSPAEVAQLQKVSNGTAVGNAAKAVGKLAPTTLGGIGVKAGIPFAVGNAMGGPVVGTTLAGTTMGVGLAGRIISRLSTGHQAELARVLVMNGGKLPRMIPNGLSGPVRQAIGSLSMIGAPLTGHLADMQQRALAPN